MTSDTESKSLRRKLGRGLGSLLSTPVRVDLSPPSPATAPQIAPAIQPSAPASNIPRAGRVPSIISDAPAETGDSDYPPVRSISLKAILRNPKQPRQDFDPVTLEQLAASIRQSGLMQPIIVRPIEPKSKGAPKEYQIIAGERRWRAAQLAGLAAIPAVIRELSDQQAAEFALMENLQREDLNPIERAEAFARLISEFQLTHQEIAARVAIDRSSVTNHLRLNDLDAAIKSAIRENRLAMGHAKALLAITNISARSALAAAAVREQWSVRELERRVRELQDASGLQAAGGGDGGGGAGTGGTGAGGAAAMRAALPHMADLERRLGEHLGTKVQLKTGRAKGSGKLVIDFYSLDQFEGIMRRLDFDAE